MPEKTLEPSETFKIIDSVAKIDIKLNNSLQEAANGQNLMKTE